LHGDQIVVHFHFFREEIRPDGGFVLLRKFSVHVLIHQRRFPDAGVAEDDQFQKRSLSFRKEREKERKKTKVVSVLSRKERTRGTREKKKGTQLLHVDASNTKRAQKVTPIAHIHATKSPIVHICPHLYLWRETKRHREKESEKKSKK